MIARCQPSNIRNISNHRHDTDRRLTAFTVLGESDALSTVTLAVMLAVAAAAVGWGEAQHGKPFASGHWVLVASAALASSGAFFLPPLAYVAGHFGQSHHASHPATGPHTMSVAGPAATVMAPHAPVVPRNTPVQPLSRILPVLAATRLAGR